MGSLGTNFSEGQEKKFLEKYGPAQGLTAAQVKGDPSFVQTANQWITERFNGQIVDDSHVDMAYKKNQDIVKTNPAITRNWSIGDYGPKEVGVEEEPGRPPRPKFDTALNPDGSLQEIFRL